jgi:endo-1,4-beta-xylanase
MRHTLIFVLLANLLLNACALAPIATPVPSDTPLPTATATSTPAPTVTPTATPTPIPTIRVGNLALPDPRYSNPELFDLSKPDAPIPQFVNAMRMAGIEVDPNQVADTLSKNYEVRTGVDGKPYILATYTLTDKNSTGYTMGLSAEQKEKGEWIWHEAYGSVIARRRGIERGTLLEWYRAEKDSKYLETIKTDYTHISLNIEFVWIYLYPNGNKLDTYDLNKVDQALMFAQTNNLTVDLEGLTWGLRSQLPDWLVKGNFTKDELTKIMTNHIKAMITRYKGRFQRVNVVSEPFGNIWESSFWSDEIGLDNYVQTAFRTAREADPDAILTIVDINDSDQLFNLVKRLNDQEQATNNRKLINAVGWEMPFFLPGSNTNVKDYLDLQKRAVALEKFRQSIRRYHEIGVEVYITELFIDMTDVPGTPEQKLTFQAELYRNIQQIGIEEGVSVTMYSFYDNPTIYPQGAGRINAMPYPRDVNYQPKPAYYSLLNSLLNARHDHQ